MSLLGMLFLLLVSVGNLALGFGAAMWLGNGPKSLGELLGRGGHAAAGHEEHPPAEPAAPTGHH